MVGECIICGKETPRPLEMYCQGHRWIYKAVAHIDAARVALKRGRLRSAMDSLDKVDTEIAAHMADD